MTLILRLCNSCKFYNEDTNTCKAFPDGIKLKSSDTHFESIPEQVGDTIYEMDLNKYDEFDMYRRIHPEVRFPILLTYDTIEEGESLTQKDLEVVTDE